MQLSSVIAVYNHKIGIWNTWNRSIFWSSFFFFFFFYNFQSLLKRITTWFISLDEMLEIMRESLRIITATLILQSVIWEKRITCPFLAKMAGQVNRLFELKMKKEKRKKKLPSLIVLLLYSCKNTRWKLAHACVCASFCK